MLNINLDKISDLDFKTREAYKTLRTNVQFCGDDVKLISLTSSVLLDLLLCSYFHNHSHVFHSRNHIHSHINNHSLSF